MKALRLVLLAAAVMMMWPLVAGAAVNLTGSPHDLSDNTADATAGICIFCHTPHRGDPASDRPLWNHTLASGSLTWSPTSTERGTALPTSKTAPEVAGSLACLSCHDGTVALGSVAVWWNSATNTSVAKNFAMTAAGVITGAGTLSNTASMYIDPANMSKNHPIGVTIPGASPGFTPFNAVVTINGDADGVRLDANSRVQCGSCHNPHLYDLNITYGPFLKKSNASSNLCKVCHNL